ncbi:MAG: hypothetical protein R3E79_14210 [Caldilineaceae bacterium]
MPKPKTNQPSSPTQDRLRLILALLVVLFLVYFLFTGNDPLGLFTEQSTPTPPVAEQTTPNGTEESVSGGPFTLPNPTPTRGRTR